MLRSLVRQSRPILTRLTHGSGGVGAQSLWTQSRPSMTYGSGMRQFTTSEFQDTSSSPVTYTMDQAPPEEPIERLPLPPGVSGEKFGLYKLKGTEKDWRLIKGAEAVVAVHGPEEQWVPAIPNEGASGGQFAVIMAGGNQHKVMVGDVLYTNRMKGEVNEEIELDNVLMVGAYDWTVFGRPLIAGAKVKGIVEEQTLSGKVLLEKFKKRKGYRRRWGHRQPITRTRISEIVFEFPKAEDISEYEVPYVANRPHLPNHMRNL